MKGRIIITGLLISSALAATLGACAASSGAATAPALTSKPAAEELRAVVLVQKAQQLPTALETGRTMLGGRELPAQAFTVVVCGEGVASLRAGGELDAELVSAASAGVRIVACGISLERAGVKVEELSPSVTVVENGLIEVLRLQHQGFLSVEL